MLIREKSIMIVLVTSTVCRNFIHFVKVACHIASTSENIHTIVNHCVYGLCITHIEADLWFYVL